MNVYHGSRNHEVIDTVCGAQWLTVNEKHQHHKKTKPFKKNPSRLQYKLIKLQIAWPSHYTESVTGGLEDHLYSTYRSPIHKGDLSRIRNPEDKVLEA